MDDVHLMQVLHGRYDLARIDGTEGLVKSAICLQFFVEFTEGSILHDNVDSSVIKEEAVHLENVVVLEMAVDFDLSPQLTNDLRVDELLLAQYF